MIAIHVGGVLISQAQLLESTLRYDLVPVPVTLEFSVIHSAELEKALVVDAEISVGEFQLPLTLLKVQPLKTQTIKEGKRIGAIACVAIFKGLQSLITPSHKAIIQSATSFNEALRGCGAKASLLNNLPLPEFVCLKGRLPTERLALYLQQEAAVMRTVKNRIECAKIDALFKQDPIAKYDPSAVAWVNNPTLKNNQVTSFVSVHGDGSTVVGEDTKAGRPIGYKARLDARQLRNLEKVLVHQGTILRPYDEKVVAGQILEISEKKYVILTVAHRFVSGALGGQPVMASKAWLSALVRD